MTPTQECIITPIHMTYICISICVRQYRVLGNESNIQNSPLGVKVSPISHLTLFVITIFAIDWVVALENTSLTHNGFLIAEDRDVGIT